MLHQRLERDSPGWHHQPLGAWHQKIGANGRLGGHLSLSRWQNCPSRKRFATWFQAATDGLPPTQHQHLCLVPYQHARNQQVGYHRQVGHTIGLEACSTGKTPQLDCHLAAVKEEVAKLKEVGLIQSVEYLNGSLTWWWLGSLTASGGCALISLTSTKPVSRITSSCPTLINLLMPPLVTL